MSREYKRTDTEVTDYVQQQLRKFNNGGSSHDAYTVTRIAGFGFPDLHILEKPLVGFGQDDDPWYQQYFKNWDEVNALIKQLKDTATEAWGEE